MESLVLIVEDEDHIARGLRFNFEAEGYRVEAGPNTFLAKAPFCAFATRHGLWPLLEAAEPESRRRWLFQGGRLVELPHGLGSAISTPLVSRAAKWRILREPFVPQGDGARESVHDFVSRRLGDEVATNLVGAFLTGVYAGDERTLGAEAVFPSLVDWERSHGSIVRGALAQALAARRSGSGGDAEKGRRGTWSARGGLGVLAQHLADSLPGPVLLETTARELARDARDWRITLSGPDGDRDVRARAVLVATPSAAAAGLLRGPLPEAAATLDAIPYAPIVAVGLGADPAAARGEIEGFGFIVPRSADLRLLGCLFMSRLFRGRAPEGRELLHCMLGGVRWPAAVDQTDDEILDCVLGDLDRTLGLREAPKTLTLERWPRAIPQPGVDHLRRVEGVMRAVADTEGLALAGSYVAGVSVADTLESGVRAAGELLRGLAAPDTVR